MFAEAGVAAGASGAMAWAVRGRSSQVFAPSIWRGPRDERSIALTFDDGPSESTPELLQILAGYGVKATFFEVGSNVRRLPGISKAVAAAGHEIGNHSDTHPIFCFRSAAFMGGQIARAQDAIGAATGASPRWLRAPYGVRWPGLARAQRETGVTGVMWTAIGLDWKLPGVKIASRLLGAARSGAIFCLHDGRELRKKPDVAPTLEAVRRLVPELLERGYLLKTVSELCRTI